MFFVKSKTIGVQGSLPLLPTPKFKKKKKKLLDCTGSFDRKSAFCAFAPGRHFQSFISWYLSDIKLFVKLCKTPVEQEDLVGKRECVLGAW